MNDLSVSKEDQDVFLNSLRTQTAESHEQLEHNELSTAILSPEVAITDYQNYLIRMYGVIAGCEKYIFPTLETVFPDLRDRRRSNLIISDLKATGMQQTEIDQIPVYNFSVSSKGEALGVMYVLEGSTLGGKVLYKHIQKNLGLDESTGNSFFWGYGTNTGTMWKNFVHTFSEYAITNKCEQEVISGATQTFTITGDWLSQNTLTRK